MIELATEDDDRADVDANEEDVVDNEYDDDDPDDSNGIPAAGDNEDDGITSAQEGAMQDSEVQADGGVEMFDVAIVTMPFVFLYLLLDM